MGQEKHEFKGILKSSMIYGSLANVPLQFLVDGCSGIDFDGLRWVPYLACIPLLNNAELSKEKQRLA
jgi:hypothetical protein